MAKLEADIIIGNIGSYYWNKTTDKLPPVGCYVLGYWGLRSEPRMLVCKINGKGDDHSWQGLDYSTYYDGAITHWMHLPNAPAQEDNDD